MCTYVFKNKIEKQAQLYFALKLTYPEGKIKLNTLNISYISNLLGVHNKTTKTNFRKLEKLGWIKKNNKTKYYIIRSIDFLRSEFFSKSRISVEFRIKDLPTYREFLIAAIITYLHMDYWRKKKGKRSVLNTGGTYNSFSSSFLSIPRAAPISIYGISKLYNISKTKVSRLKNLAASAGYLNIKHNYDSIIVESSIVKSGKKYYPEEMRKDIVFKDGKYQRQLVDLITPYLCLKKRKKLGPYNTGYISSTKK